MKYDPEKHQPRSIRLRGYDYTQPGAYFVTLVTQNRIPLFGKIMDGRMQLSRFGNIVDIIWRRLPRHFRHIRLDEYIVMSNHIHAILWIVGEVPTPWGSSPKNLIIFHKAIAFFVLDI